MPPPRPRHTRAAFSGFMQRDLPLLRAWTDSQARCAATDNVGPEPSEAVGESKQHYRSVWISDLRLGTPGCQAEALLGFLKYFDSDHLFLVGDIIDGWQLRRSWYWPQSHNDVVQKLLRKARKGTRVVFIPGNHDEFARRYLGHDFGGIEVAEDLCTKPPMAAACGSSTAICSTA